MSLSKEERLKKAIDAFNKGLFSSKTACAEAFDVPRSTLLDRLRGVPSRNDILANNRKLSKLEEETLEKWLLDMAQRGLPLRIFQVQYLAKILLSARLNSPDALISERWVNRFIKRHDTLKSRYTRQYDYQRAKCEDPEIIEKWFKLVQNTIQKYGILEQDIYNMDETGFQMGVISTTKVVCGAETRRSDAKALQSGNREWITSIVAVNASGWVLPSQIIFAGKKHQSQWYTDLPEGFRISLSENGWTNDNLGLEWLQNVFNPATASRTIGRYRLLILDGHSSHATAAFDRYCMNNLIIPLYMPPHSSHLLQPLDVTCFQPLKHFYGQHTYELMQNGIETIDKMDFLSIYTKIHHRAMSSSNIISGFKATGLIPLNASVVISKLKIQVRTPTPPPPTSSNSNQSFYLKNTPNNLHHLHKQKQYLPTLQDPLILLEKVIKGAEISMQNALLLQDEIKRHRTAKERQKRKKEIPRHFIQDGGSLTVNRALEIIQEREERQQEADAAAAASRPRRAPRCSNCGQEGHNRLKCPSKN